MDLNSDQLKIIIAALRHTALSYGDRAKETAKIDRTAGAREMAFAQACGGISDHLQREYERVVSPIIIRH